MQKITDSRKMEGQIMNHIIIKANHVDNNGNLYTEECLKNAMNNKTVPLLVGFNYQSPQIGKATTYYDKKAKVVMGKICLQENASETYRDLVKTNNISMGCSFTIKKRDGKNIKKIDLLSTCIYPKGQ